jgi:long-chain fatty acid transport protein
LRRVRSTLARAALLVGSLCVAAPARAAGLYFSDRGVRPLSRGGAFVAGADDAGAVYYNPAGLVFAGRQLLVDGAWLQYSSTYQRRALVEQVDPNSGEPTGKRDVQTFPAVEGTSPVLPIPTLAYVDPLGTRDFAFAAALWAPYAAITSYPESVRGEPAPQRYSLVSLDGSALAIGGLYAAWRPAKELALGAGVELLAGFFESTVAFSACVPDRFFCAPEQPEYDALARMRVGPILAPTGALGVIAVPDEVLRLGVSTHLPIAIDSPATIDVRLPSASAFQSARQSGNRANVEFELPWLVRLGIELRPLPTTRAEVAFVYETWSQHDAIDVAPEDIALQNVELFPPRYQVAPIRMQRGFQDAWSVRLGGEQRLDVGRYALDVRAGVMYEKSAIPPEYLSVTTVDLDKATVAIGGSLHVGRWRLDGVVGRVFGFAVEVDPSEARIQAVNPVLANPPAHAHAVNGGSYSADANVMGVGLALGLDGEAMRRAPKR